jgi:transglutaminase/protease-like cytokinesis protein 3
MDKQQHIQNLKNNIASWETNAESLRQSILSKPNQMLQSKLDGILAGIERDKAELEVLEAVPPLPQKEAIKDQIKEGILYEEAKEEAIAELKAEGLIKEPPVDAILAEVEKK